MNTPSATKALLLILRATFFLSRCLFFLRSLSTRRLVYPAAKKAAKIAKAARKMDREDRRRVPGGGEGVSDDEDVGKFLYCFFNVWRFLQ